MKILAQSFVTFSKSNAYEVVTCFAHHYKRSADGSHPTIRGVVAPLWSNKTPPTSSVVPLPDLLLYAVSSWNKKTSPPPLVGLVSNKEKIKKIFRQWVPFSVPFGDCEKRTITRSAPLFAFRLISLAQELPLSNIFAIAFLFFLCSTQNDKNLAPPGLK